MINTGASSSLHGLMKRYIRLCDILLCSSTQLCKSVYTGVGALTIVWQGKPQEEQHAVQSIASAGEACW